MIKGEEEMQTVCGHCLNYHHKNEIWNAPCKAGYTVNALTLKLGCPNYSPDSLAREEHPRRKRRDKKPKIEYKDYEKMIQKICWSFYRRYQYDPYIRLEMDDLILESHLVFVKSIDRYTWETKFSTFLYCNIKNALINLIRTQRLKKRKSVFVDMPENLASGHSIERKCIFIDLLEKASDSVQEIVTAVLTGQQEITSMTITGIRKYLVGIGWKHGRINNSFAELKSILKTV